MTAFYNEIEPFAAAWLRELINAGQIAPGVVDERDIRDIRPDELAGFTQCHFFAGIGGWALAARHAGIPDDYPLWSGSCPCQPFSAAGGRSGFADERHLWPAFFHLIEQCEPELVVGEQVSGSNVDPWFNLVQADLEGMGYAFGLCPAPSAGFGAPHIRDRAFWVADVGSERRDGQQVRIQRRGPFEDCIEAGGRGGFGGLADTDGRDASAQRQQRGREQRQFSQNGDAMRMADPARGGQPVFGNAMEPRRSGHADGGVNAGRPGPVNGFWRDADWLGCTDGKWRPVEPGTFPLAHGLPARVGRLRGYGNAINAEQAAIFLEAVIDALRTPQNMQPRAPGVDGEEVQHGGVSK